jgi:hypothetical protein
MRKAILSALVVSGSLLTIGFARADDMDRHRDHPPGVDVQIPVPVPTPDHEHDRMDGGGCESRTVTKENDEGDTKTVHKEHCD